jgi:hypothetical protein
MAEDNGAGIWPSGQSDGLARRRSRFDPRQGHLDVYPSALSLLCIALCENPHLFGLSPPTSQKLLVSFVTNQSDRVLRADSFMKPLCTI